MTREDWLLSAVNVLQPILKQHKLEAHPKIAVSCGFPSKGGVSKNQPITGETWPSTATFDQTVHIFISPLEDKAEIVLGILLRELIHASLPDDEGNGPNFKAVCKELGFEGGTKNKTPGYELQVKLDALAEQLGPYPNAHIILAEKEKLEKPKKKTSFKLFCEHKRAGDSKCLIRDKQVGKDFNVTVSAKQLKLGNPQCVCSFEMAFEEEDFKIYEAQQEGE